MSYDERLRARVRPRSKGKPSVIRWHDGQPPAISPTGTGIEACAAITNKRVGLREEVRESITSAPNRYSPLGSAAAIAATIPATVWGERVANVSIIRGAA